MSTEHDGEPDGGGDQAGDQRVLLSVAETWSS
jgi:hypothetical protein